MKYFLEFIIKALVEHSEDMDIQQTEEDSQTTFFVRLHPSDIGKVIGKNGRTISAIRTVLASACPEGQKVKVEILEENS